MGRAVLAVIVGYLVMFVLVFVSFTLAYMALGPEGAFQPGSYEVSTKWVVLSIVIGLIAAVAGGLACAGIAPRRGPLMALCIVILVFGLIAAIGAMGQEDPGPRAGDVANLEAMMRAHPPAWISVVNVVVGITGVLIGGRKALNARPPAA